MKKKETKKSLEVPHLFSNSSRDHGTLKYFCSLLCQLPKAKCQRKTSMPALIFYLPFWSATTLHQLAQYLALHLPSPWTPRTYGGMRDTGWRKRRWRKGQKVARHGEDDGGERDKDTGDEEKLQETEKGKRLSDMEKTMEGMERKMEGMERRKEGWRKCYSRWTKLSAAHTPILHLWRQPQRTMIRMRIRLFRERIMGFQAGSY